MRILFIPSNYGDVSHLIPLVVLRNMLADKAGYTCAFLLSAKVKNRYGHYFRKMNMDVLDIDYEGTIPEEIAAHHFFKPEMIVDDFSVTSGYVCAMYPKPRISIMRTGIFPGYKPLNKDHKHCSAVGSLDFFSDQDVTYLQKMGLEKVKTLPDFFNSQAKVIPGIRSVELLPEAVQQDPAYFFSGPLIMDDLFIPEALEGFLRMNAERKKVYLTYGITQVSPPEIEDCMEYLLQSEVAVMTNVGNDRLMKQYQTTYFYSPFFPMHYVCRNADLVIHHCGSGAYHYPILHTVPTFTLGTQCYDRDDVAVRLEQLGVSDHLPSPQEFPEFTSGFKSKASSLLQENDAERSKRLSRMHRLSEEIHDTRAAFNFDNVLSYAVERFQASLHP